MIVMAELSSLLAMIVEGEMMISLVANCELNADTLYPKSILSCQRICAFISSGPVLYAVCFKKKG